MDNLSEQDWRILVIAYWAFNGVCPAGNGDFSHLAFRQMVAPMAGGGCFILPLGLQMLSRKYRGKVPRVADMTPDIS